MANRVETDANQLRSDAKAALEAGRKHFTPILVTTYFTSGLTRAADDWAYYVDLIESLGWNLDQWIVSMDPKGAPIACPIFTR
jgi:hypothetical protein